MVLKLLTSILIVIHTIVYVEGKAKSVNVALDAKWRSTPLLLEASEFLAKESPDYFWRFLQDVTNLDPKQISKESNQSLYNSIQKFAGRHLSPLQLNLLKLSLSLRAFSPKVQVYQQLGNEAVSSKKCSTFVNVQSEETCDVDKIVDLIKSAGDRSPPVVYSFDHSYPGPQQHKIKVILYGELGTQDFKQFYSKILNLIVDEPIHFIVRHFVQTPANVNVRLSGYGVELAIKSTEYKAKDDTKVEGMRESDNGSKDQDIEGEEVQGFIFSKLRERHPELKENLREFRHHLIDSETELAPLKVWQLQDLSLQAAERILSSDNKESLSVLTDISQNFPTQARSLVGTSVSSELKKEISKNQEVFERHHSLGVGESALYLNGLTIDLDVFDIFTVLDTMNSEAKLIEGLHSLGFKGDNLDKLLHIDLKSGDDTRYAIDIRHSAVQYLNDLENDRGYQGWPNSIQDILRPTFPGMLRHVAKNIFHLVFVVNPVEDKSKDLLKMAEAFSVHKAPIRIGIIFVTNQDEKATPKTDASMAMARAFNFIKLDQNPSKALSFITDVYEKASTADELTSDLIIKEFQSQFPGEDNDIVFGEDQDDYDDIRKAGLDFISRSGLSDFPQVLMNGVPFKKQFLSTDTFEEGVVTEIMTATPTIQKAVYNGELTDRENVLDWLMSKDNVLPRLNSRILSPEFKTLDLTENVDSSIFEDVSTFSRMTVKDMVAIVSDRMKYITKKGRFIKFELIIIIIDESSIRAVTLWLVCDVETPQGREIFYNAIKELKHSNEIRLGLVFNPASLTEDHIISRAIYVAYNTLGNNHAKSFITKLVKEENVAELKAGTKTLKDLEVHGMDMNKFMTDFNKQNKDFLKSYKSFVVKVLNFEENDRGVIANGRIVGPLGNDEMFTPEDFNLLEKFTLQQAAAKIREQIKTMDLDSKQGNELVLKTCSLLTGQPQIESRKKVQFHSDKHSVLKLSADESSPAFILEAIVDPVSREAQKLGPILMVLREIFNVEIRVFMNCRDKLSEMPLTSFYRYVLEPDVQFLSNGSLASGPEARFTSLPQKSLLTLNMNPPESWLVEAVRSVYDLDNILLEEVETGVSADFELEYLLLEGHCHDSNTMQPPRGLQFILGTDTQPAIVDTIVMANLGYFQLKANPGVWNLKLREGRSREIYDIQSHENTDSPDNSKDIITAIQDFKSKIIRVKVAKKADKQNEQLLVDDDKQSGLWDTLSSSLSGGGTNGEDESDKTLNIFSVASGHLYERFLRIMMLSVYKNTKSKVKFWFIKNFLSPSFKDFIPHMAKEYNFEYELVQYKWPRWLNQQKEKQRIIWGFVKVFVEISTNPIIFQFFFYKDRSFIVRTDMQELHDLDLGGAPYGYTPFCDSKREMDGFRFWKSGYWASHLAGRKYHISALYVVDLKRFRRIAAGDRLRGQYQGLSQDPNSLSNLDQDLPNNMIHQVAIKSLPQDWLYCETWCDPNTKKDAKTIDLCNNPLTKEPKLKAAMRIVPEWKNYDYEIKVLWDRIYGTNTRSQIEYNPPGVEAENIGWYTNLSICSSHSLISDLRSPTTVRERVCCGKRAMSY
ncbi:hypothetical protein LOTGIDRAFT_137613 [Lottia gigantea]|uniref:UDP-glucose:glycoprotein glucosyltransferase 1 n=1 Tax=Lottia gigantea TaxID=225164 RepID=V4AGU0_LOTGI|nr:hypothetical protein LOTGIDRAFT_137613 [Lottia gigantea]ESP03274.1 hypothetical protein LOTGIDRAFT_137613 [Lottia gigantea]